MMFQNSAYFIMFLIFASPIMGDTWEQLPQVLPAFFNKIGCAVIFCHGGVLKGEITSPIYLSPTQAVQGDNPIVKK